MKNGTYQTCPPKWRKSYIWKAYKYALLGYGEREIAKECGNVSKGTYYTWRNEKKEFKKAITAGRADYKKKYDDVKEITNLSDFIHGKLPEHLIPEWDYIEAAYKEDPTVTIAELDKALDTTDDNARQALFFYSWYRNHFSVSAARLELNITRTIWRKWKSDIVFMELFDEMDVIKSDFFENALVNLVSRGHATAIIAANESFNKAKYGKKVGVEHSGHVEHSHRHLIAIDELDLPLDVLKAIRAAVEHRRAIDDGEAIEITSKMLE